MKTWKYVLLVFGIIVILEFPYTTVFPIMGEDEYFVDEYGCIHDKHCPYKDVPWFTVKHRKYDFIRMKGQDICKECLLLEEEKLNTLHEINIEREVLRLKRAGASDDYINNKLEQYE